MNIVGVEGVGGGERLLRGRRLPHAGAARRGRAWCWCSIPDLAGRARSTSGPTPTVSDFLMAIPFGVVAYTGIETISNMAEEARDYGHTIRAGWALVVGAVSRVLAFLPAIALSAMPVRGRRDPRSRCRRRRGLRGRPDPRRGGQPRPRGRSRGAAEIYVGVLAATILFIATNAGMIGVSRLTYSMGQYRQLPEGLRAPASEVPHAVRGDHDLRPDRVTDDPARPGRVPGDHLRVRRDAVVHGRPLRGGWRCA